MEHDPNTTQAELEELLTLRLGEIEALLHEQLNETAVALSDAEMNTLEDLVNERVELPLEAPLDSLVGDIAAMLGAAEALLWSHEPGADVTADRIYAHVEAVTGLDLAAGYAHGVDAPGPGRAEWDDAFRR